MLRWLFTIASVALVDAPARAPALSTMATSTAPLVARHVVLQAARGDSIDALLRKQGFTRDEISPRERAARRHADLRRLESGRALQLDRDDAGQLLAMR